MQKRKYQFQGGDQLSKIPHLSGLYAWYYKPLVIDTDALRKTLVASLESSNSFSLEVEMRYGVRLWTRNLLERFYSSQRQSPIEIIDEAITYGDIFLSDFFKSDMVQLFTRPIYIGIAKDLYQRIYVQHYLTLDSLWNNNSQVSRYLATAPDATVQSVMDTLNFPHSFALDARVRNMAPRDLMVNIFPTDNLPDDIGSDIDEGSQGSTSRRALEKLLQLIADPICGRR